MIVPLVATGTALQGYGFYDALKEAIRMRRSEIPDYPALHVRVARVVVQRVELVLIRLGLRPGKVGRLAGSTTAKFTATGSLRERHFRGGEVEDRLRALEEEVQDHREQQQHENRALTEMIDAVGRDVEAVKIELEDARKQRLVRSLDREERGIYVFIFGLVVSSVGALV